MSRLMQWTAHGVSEQLARAMALAASVAVAQPVAAGIASIWHTNFERQTVSSAIESSMKWIGLGMVMLAAVL